MVMLLHTASSAVSNRSPDLEAWLALQRLVCPSARVSGGFYEWRSVSRYRAVAGLHLGYDVAMPAGTRVVAGWPGQVTRVVRWSGPEFGVTVVSPSGYETTYGHLAPAVRAGDVVNSGDPVGTVANDHVDVKMRGPDGAYYDFGHGTPEAAYLPTRRGALDGWQALAREMAGERHDLERARARLAVARMELEDGRRAARRAQAALPDLRALLAEGGVSRLAVERAESASGDQARQVEALARKVGLLEDEVAARRQHLELTRSLLATAERALAAFGVSTRGLSPPLGKVQAEATSLDPARLEAARRRAEEMQRLFEMGAVSRAERDRAGQAAEAAGRGH
jgi:hypothetical protein